MNEQQQATQLASQDQQTLYGVNANIQNLIQQQQAAGGGRGRGRGCRPRSQPRRPRPRPRAAQAASSSPAHKHLRRLEYDAGGATSSAALPPLAPGAAGAVQAAEREVGVPYVWGGASPSTGFDCSGLVMWAYAQVGISLPHYSGAQFEDTTHIPLADIEPGDLLFYGPGGSDHVAMYVGGGSMIEAPYTGASVWITAIRTGGDFAGVGPGRRLTAGPGSLTPPPWRPPRLGVFRGSSAAAGCCRSSTSQL